MPATAGHGRQAQIRRALVTGITGFTGQYVVRVLEDLGYAVHGFSHTQAPASERVTRVDLSDRQMLAQTLARIQPDVVIHLAGISFVQHDDAAAIYHTNIVATRYLLQALAELPNPPRKVVLASSANVYRQAGARPLDETSDLQPANDYAVSKLAMEHMAHLWKEKLPIVVARPFNYTGVGQAEQFLIPKIVAHFQRREAVIELGNIDIERDFSDVRMVAQAYGLLAEKASPSEVYNICSGRLISLKRILEMMQDIAGHQISVKVNPRFVRAQELKSLCGNPGRLLALQNRPEANAGQQIILQSPPMRETLKWMFEQGRWQSTHR